MNDPGEPSWIGDLANILLTPDLTVEQIHNRVAVILEFADTTLILEIDGR